MNIANTIKLFRVFQLIALRSKTEQQHSRSCTFLLIIPSLLIINVCNKLALVTSPFTLINYPNYFCISVFFTAINKTDNIGGPDYMHYPLLHMMHGVLGIKLELTYLF